MYAVFKDQWDIVDELMSLNLSKHSSVLLQSLLAMINRYTISIKLYQPHQLF